MGMHVRHDDERNTVVGAFAATVYWMGFLTSIAGAEATRLAEWSRRSFA
jgi:hypothetical protein